MTIADSYLKSAFCSQKLPGKFLQGSELRNGSSDHGETNVSSPHGSLTEHRNKGSFHYLMKINNVDDDIFTTESQAMIYMSGMSHKLKSPWAPFRGVTTDF